MVAESVSDGRTVEPGSLGECKGAIVDDLDKFILDAELKDGWRATGIHEVQRDQPNRCRTYLARNAAGELGFVKVLPPSTDDLEQMRLHLEEFYFLSKVGFAKSSLENLLFVRSGFTYMIYRESAAFDTNGAGIRVKSPDGKSIRLSCNEENPASDLYVLHDLGLRVLPEESLASVEEPAALPAESPKVDLLQGALTHDAALITKALASGADPNFRGPRDSGVIGALVYGRIEASSQNRLQEFDAETDRLIALLVSHGASLTTSFANGGTLVDVLWNSAPYATVRKIVDSGWPEDFQYRLYAGALLGDPILVKDSLEHGANPNSPVRGNRVLSAAILKTSVLRRAGEDKDDLEKALSATEELLIAGASIDEGSAHGGGGDIVKAFGKAISPVCAVLSSVLIDPFSPDQALRSVSGEIEPIVDDSFKAHIESRGATAPIDPLVFDFDNSGKTKKVLVVSFRSHMNSSDTYLAYDDEAGGLLTAASLKGAIDGQYATTVFPWVWENCKAWVARERAAQPPNWPVRTCPDPDAELPFVTTHSHGQQLHWRAAYLHLAPFRYHSGTYFLLTTEDRDLWTRAFVIKPMPQGRYELTCKLAAAPPN